MFRVRIDMNPTCQKKRDDSAGMREILRKRTNIERRKRNDAMVDFD